MLSNKKIEKLDLKEIDTLSPLEIDRIHKNFKNEFEEFLLVGGFPEWFEVRELKKWSSVLSNMISKKAIYEDIVNIFRIRNPKILESIFLFIIANQNKILSYEKINEIAKLKHEILINYLEYLKSSYLVVEILKFAKLKEQLKAKKKYLCIDQGLRNCLLSEYELKEDNVGFVVENVVGVHLYLHSKKKDSTLMYHKVNEEIDFVLKEKEEIIPVEIKYRSHVEEKEIKNIKKFIVENNCRKGFVITKDLFKVIKFDSKMLIFIPAIVFCLGLE
jgi:predicted AAA+ superfamily ATPase